MILFMTARFNALLDCSIKRRLEPKVQTKFLQALASSATKSRGSLTVALPVFLIILLGVVTPQAVAADRKEDTVLVRQLIGRNEEVRERALRRLEADRSAAVHSLSALVTAAARISEDTQRSRLAGPYVVRLIHLIGSIDDEVSEQGLIRLLDSPHTGIAMIAADTLGREKFYGAIDYLKRHIGHPEFERSYAFRFNLIRAFMQMAHPDALEFVSGQSKNLDGQLKYKIDQAFAEITIDDFRGDQERYEQWKADYSDQTGPESLEANSSSGIFKKASHEPESLKRIRMAKQQYYGIDIHAKRLMFIIDYSGSMKEYAGSETRLDRAKSELIRAIDALPENTEFALMFYDDTVATWRNKLVPATEQNKQQANYFIRTLQPGDTTNTHGALRMSLEFDDSLEAVFLLTDGRPTSGEIVFPDSIIDDILHRNRFRHLNFNTIGIDLSPETTRFLKTLSKESGGEFRTADFRKPTP